MARVGACPDPWPTRTVMARRLGWRAGRATRALLRAPSHGSSCALAALAAVAAVAAIVAASAGPAPGSVRGRPATGVALPDACDADPFVLGPCRAGALDCPVHRRSAGCRSPACGMQGDRPRGTVMSAAPTGRPVHVACRAALCGASQGSLAPSASVSPPSATAPRPDVTHGSSITGARSARHGRTRARARRSSRETPPASGVIAGPAWCGRVVGDVRGPAGCVGGGKFPSRFGTGPGVVERWPSRRGSARRHPQTSASYL